MACDWVEMDVSEWFAVNVGLRQGCVKFPWLLNVYLDGGVLVKMMELQCAKGGRFEIDQLFADDTALVADSEENCVDW